MFYSGSISPPRSPALKKPKKEMSDVGPSSGAAGVKESSLMWPMLSRSNYTKWAMFTAGESHIGTSTLVPVK